MLPRPTAPVRRAAAGLAVAALGRTGTSAGGRREAGRDLRRLGLGAPGAADVRPRQLLGRGRRDGQGQDQATRARRPKRMIKGFLRGATPPAGRSIARLGDSPRHGRPRKRQEMILTGPPPCQLKSPRRRGGVVAGRHSLGSCDGRCRPSNESPIARSRPRPSGRVSSGSRMIWPRPAEQADRPVELPGLVFEDELIDRADAVGGAEPDVRALAPGLEVRVHVAREADDPAFVRRPRGGGPRGSGSSRVARARGRSWRLAAASNSVKAITDSRTGRVRTLITTRAAIRAATTAAPIRIGRVRGAVMGTSAASGRRGGDR